LPAEPRVAALLKNAARRAVWRPGSTTSELKYSHAAAMPFQRLKIRLKKEIVTLGYTEADPTRQVGIYVDLADWNALIANCGTRWLIDHPQCVEVAMAHFRVLSIPASRASGQIQGFCPPIDAT